MTQERKNEIWTMLTPKERNEFRTEYDRCFERGLNRRVEWRAAYKSLFGEHNLTSELERNNIVDKDNGNPEAKELANSFQSFTDWNKYRLELAKEIAAAEISKLGSVNPYALVARVNEIVRFLKETAE